MHDKPRGPKKRADFATLLDSYLPDSKIIASKVLNENEPPKPGASPSILNLPIEARIDLHGLNLEQARRRVDCFLKDCAAKGIRKVLIIHGKGSGVLQKGITSWLDAHPLAGRRDKPSIEDGGSGALIVYIKSK